MSLPQPELPDYIEDESGLFLKSPVLMEYSWLAHAVTTRHFSHRDAQRRDELRRLQDALGLPQFPLVYAQQKHTNHVGVVDDVILNHCGADGRFIFKETDAIVCARPGVSISVCTADCVPVFIVDTLARAIAVVHAGWQGTLLRITEHAVAALQRSGSKAEDLVAWIGPAIGACCYEVSWELIARFREEFTDAQRAGLPFHEDRMLDVVALNEWQLQRSGVPVSNISNCDICTKHEKGTFYSYRGDGAATGRIISMMTVTY